MNISITCSQLEATKKYDSLPFVNKVNMLFKNLETEIVDKLLVHQWSSFPYVTGMAPGIYILELSFRNFQSAAAFVESL